MHAGQLQETPCEYFQISSVFYTIWWRITDFWPINFKTSCSKSYLIPFGNMKIKFLFITKKSLIHFYFKFIVDKTWI